MPQLSANIINISIGNWYWSSGHLTGNVMLLPLWTISLCHHFKPISSIRPPATRSPALIFLCPGQNIGHGINLICQLKFYRKVQVLKVKCMEYSQLSQFFTSFSIGNRRPPWKILFVWVMPSSNIMQCVKLLLLEQLHIACNCRGRE